MFLKWDIRRAFDTIRPKLQRAIKEGSLEHDFQPRAGVEAWQRFQKNAVWLDMQDWLIERTVRHLMDMSAEEDMNKIPVIQGYIKECSTFLSLPDDLLAEARERSAGNSTEE